MVVWAELEGGTGDGQPWDWQQQELKGAQGGNGCHWSLLWAGQKRMGLLAGAVASEEHSHCQNQRGTGRKGDG